MPNRAERRAQAKAGRRGVPSQYDQTRGRGRSGMIDEYQLQQKSQRLQDGTDGTEWKPSGGTIADTETLLTTNPVSYTHLDRLVHSAMPAARQAPISFPSTAANRHTRCSQAL